MENLGCEDGGDGLNPVFVGHHELELSSNSQENLMLI